LPFLEAGGTKMNADAINHVAIGERDRRRDRVIGERDVVVPLQPLALTIRETDLWGSVPIDAAIPRGANETSSDASAHYARTFSAVNYESL
jgi:hypothetical protein